MCPVAAITAMVLTKEIAIIATRNSFILSQLSNKPTPGAINISGIIKIRNLPASLTADNFMAPVHSRANKIIIPYMLAGMGRGIKRFKISPTNDIASIISNCIIYFIVALMQKTSAKLHKTDKRNKPPAGGLLMRAANAMLLARRLHSL